MLLTTSTPAKLLLLVRGLLSLGNDSPIMKAVPIMSSSHLYLCRQRRLLEAERLLLPSPSTISVKPQYLQWLCSAVTPRLPRGNLYQRLQPLLLTLLMAGIDSSWSAAGTHDVRLTWYVFNLGSTVAYDVGSCDYYLCCAEQN
jgi:hypothetical protein